MRLGYTYGARTGASRAMKYATMLLMLLMVPSAIPCPTVPGRLIRPTGPHPRPSSNWVTEHIISPTPRVSILVSFTELTGPTKGVTVLTGLGDDVAIFISLANWVAVLIGSSRLVMRHTSLETETQRKELNTI